MICFLIFFINCLSYRGLDCKLDSPDWIQDLSIEIVIGLSPDLIKDLIGDLIYDLIPDLMAYLNLGLLVNWFHF